ncbi:hypothetical protein BASA60_008539 [Batrachochytrium salamandrivorans]|nr:hypothetical protein BASA60_008539 [Batrachochytrium salamandrivorans]
MVDDRAFESPTSRAAKKQTRSNELLDTVTSPNQQRNQQQGQGLDRFKSAADTPVSQTMKTQEWRPPLQRHLNPQKEVQFITIRVRVLNGDAEHDFQARFEPGVVTAGDVANAIAEKEGLNFHESCLFSLWVVSKDLELQFRPKQDIFALLLFWNRWMMKYTHFPEADDPSHPINRHWFIYRREASVSLVEESSQKSDIVARLLYGEARRNVLTRRWTCTQADAVTLAAIQLQITHGDYIREKFPPGCLLNDGRLEHLLPMDMLIKMRPNQWESSILNSYSQWQGLSSSEARNAFLETVRSWPCYGCSFFPACMELPPSGFFEYRTQNYFIGLNYSGIVIVDFDQNRYVHILPWDDIYWEFSRDSFSIFLHKDAKAKDITLISPQSPIINNVALRLQSKWRHGSRTVNLIDKYMPQKINTDIKRDTNERLRQSPYNPSFAGINSPITPNANPPHVYTATNNIHAQTPLQGNYTQQQEPQNQYSDDDDALQNYFKQQTAAQKLREGLLSENVPIQKTSQKYDTDNMLTLADINSGGIQKKRSKIPATSQPMKGARSVEPLATGDNTVEYQKQSMKLNSSYSKDHPIQVDTSVNRQHTQQGHVKGTPDSSTSLKGSQKLMGSAGTISGQRKSLAGSLDMLASATARKFKSIIGKDTRLQDAINRSPTHFQVTLQDTGNGNITDTVLPEGFSVDSLKIRPITTSSGECISHPQTNDAPRPNIAPISPHVVVPVASKASASKIDKADHYSIERDNSLSRRRSLRTPSQSTSTRRSMATDQHTVPGIPESHVYVATSQATRKLSMHQAMKTAVDYNNQSSRTIAAEKYRTAAETSLLAEINDLEVIAAGQSREIQVNESTNQNRPLGSKGRPHSEIPAPTITIDPLEELNHLDSYVNNMRSSLQPSPRSNSAKPRTSSLFAGNTQPLSPLSGPQSVRNHLEVKQAVDSNEYTAASDMSGSHVRGIARRPTNGSRGMADAPLVQIHPKRG